MFRAVRAAGCQTGEGENHSETANTNEATSLGPVPRDSDHVITRQELNRTTLHRQLLLRRERLSPVRAIEHLAGLQAQLASSPYLALWARVDGFERSGLELETFDRFRS